MTKNPGQKHTFFSNFARFCTPKLCTCIHICLVLKNNPNYVNFYTRMISNFNYKKKKTLIFCFVRLNWHFFVQGEVLRSWQVWRLTHRARWELKYKTESVHHPPIPPKKEGRQMTFFVNGVINNFMLHHQAWRWKEHKYCTNITNKKKEEPVGHSTLKVTGVLGQQL